MVFFAERDPSSKILSINTTVLTELLKALLGAQLRPHIQHMSFLPQPFCQVLYRLNLEAISDRARFGKAAEPRSSRVPEGVEDVDMEHGERALMGCFQSCMIMASQICAFEPHHIHSFLARHQG